MVLYHIIYKKHVITETVPFVALLIFTLASNDYLSISRFIIIWIIYMYSKNSFYQLRETFVGNTL